MKCNGNMPHGAGHWEERGGEGRRWWIYSQTLRRLHLSLNGCRSKREFYSKSSSAHFEGAVGSDGLGPAFKDSFSRANNFCSYAVLVQSAYDNMLPQAEAKGS